MSICFWQKKRTVLSFLLWCLFVLKSLSYSFFSIIFNQSLTTAYIPHYDYIRTKTNDFNLDSAGVGGNRFATVLLYMTDIPEKAGGETGKFLFIACFVHPAAVSVLMIPNTSLTRMQPLQRFGQRMEDANSREML